MNDNLVLTRVPPGDRWNINLGEEAIVYLSLTEGLNAVFEKTGAKQFYIDAGAGKVWTADISSSMAPAALTKPKKHSIYGDE